MKQEIEEDIVIRKYLMGGLQPDEQLQLEERLFLDSEYFQMMKAAEDDLIDDYVYGELSPPEREGFKKYFLSTPDRQEALRIAQALKQYTSNHPLQKSMASTGEHQRHAPSNQTFFSFLRAPRQIWRLPLAAALLLAVIGASWLLVRILRPSNPPGQEQAQQPLSGEQQQAGGPTQDSRQQQSNTQSSNADSLSKPDQYAKNQEKTETASVSENKSAKTTVGNNPVREPAPPARRRPGPVYSLILIPGGPTRGDGDITRFDLRPVAGYANLQLILLGEAGFSTYQATLLTDENRPLRNWSGLKSTTGKSGKNVSLKIPTEFLTQGLYHIKLRGVSSTGDISDVSSYYFNVTKP